MNKRFLVISVLIVAAVVALAAAFASSHPDGLERVAERLGFVSQATEEPIVAPPFPDYSTRAIASPLWSTVTAGLMGAAVVAAVVMLLGKVMKGR